MKPIVSDDEDFEIPEFDFTRAVPAGFADRCKDGTMWVITTLTGEKKIYVSLDADVAERFSSPKLVNDTLRLAIKNEAKKNKKVVGKMVKK